MKMYKIVCMLVIIMFYSCSTGSEDNKQEDIFNPSTVEGVLREVTGEWTDRIYDYTIPGQYSDIQSRRITVVLPPDYNKATEYDAIYMHDGQNLFNYDQYGHGGWQADTTINTLVKETSINPLLLVCIPNAGSKREYEYSDEKTGAPHYMD